MKITVVEHVSVRLYRHIYYKGHYAGRKLAQRQGIRQVRDKWHALWMEEVHYANYLIGFYQKQLRWTLIGGVIIGQIITIAAYLWGKGGL